MAALRLPQIDLGQPAGGGRAPYAPIDTTMGPQGGAAIAQGAQQVAAGIGEATRQLTSIALEEKRKHDESIVNGEVAQAGDFATRLAEDPTLDGNGRPKGLLLRKGAAALGVADEGEKAFLQYMSQRVRGLPDPDQRRELQNRLLTQLTSLRSSFRVHEAGQLDAQADTNFAAAQSTIVSQGVRQWNDVAAVESQRQQALAGVDKQAEIRKWSPEQVVRIKRDLNTLLADGVVRNAAAAGQGVYAKKLLDFFAPTPVNGAPPPPAEFDGSKYDELKKVVRAASVQEEARPLVEDIRQRYPRDIGEQVKAAAADPRLKDVEVFNAVVSHLTAREQIDDKSDQDKVAGRLAKAVSILAAQKEGERSLDALPADLVGGLRDNPRVRGSAQAWLMLESLVREDKANQWSRPRTQAEVAAFGMFEHAMRSNPELAKQYTPERLLYEWGPTFHPQDNRAALNLLAEFNTPGKSEMSGDVHNEIRRIGQSASLWGTKGPVKPEEFVWYAALSDAARNADARWKRENGGKGNTPMTEITKTLLDKVAKGDVSNTGIFFTDTVPRVKFETQPDYAGKAFTVTDVKQLAPQDRRQVEDALRLRGKPVTEKAVLDLYNSTRAQPAPAQPARAPAPLVVPPPHVTPPAIAPPPTLTGPLPQPDVPAALPPLPAPPGTLSQFFGALNKNTWRTKEEKEAALKKIEDEVKALRAQEAP